MTRHGPGAAASAASMRRPRSPSPCRSSANPRARSAWKIGWASSGVAQTVTGPIPAAAAVAAARSINRCCSAAAPSAPSAGIIRVLAKPATGALASTATATGSVIAVLPRQLLRIGAEEVGEPQAPHQHHGPQHAMLLPAPPGGDDALGEAQRPAHALEALAERDVLHQRDLVKAAGRLERLALHENRLVAGGDPGQPRADVHEKADDQQERMPALDLDVEAAPGAAGPFEAIEHGVVGMAREPRVGV